MAITSWVGKGVGAGTGIAGASAGGGASTGAGAGIDANAGVMACTDTSSGSDFDEEATEGLCIVPLEAGLAGAGRA